VRIHPYLLSNFFFHRYILCLCPHFCCTNLFYWNSQCIPCVQWILCGTTLLFSFLPSFILRWVSSPNLALCCILIFSCTISTFMLRRDCSVLHLSLYCWYSPWNYRHLPFIRPLMDLHLDILHRHAVAQ
jgi:hypothetical protein